LDLQLQDEGGGDISSFITNGEWDLLGRYCSNSSVRDTTGTIVTRLSTWNLQK